MEALSLLENLDIDPAIKAALAAGFQSDLERYQEQNIALETRVRHDGFIIEKLKLELAHLRRIQFGRKSESLKGC